MVKPPSASGANASAIAKAPTSTGPRRRRLLIVDVLGLMGGHIEPAPQHHRNDGRVDDRVLERARVEGGKRFQEADHDAAERGERVADEPAHHGADEALEADDQSGVVIDGGRGTDENPGDRRDRRGEEKRRRTGPSGADAEEARALAVDGGGAQRLAAERRFEEDEQRGGEQRGGAGDQYELPRKRKRPDDKIAAHEGGGA